MYSGLLAALWDGMGSPSLTALLAEIDSYTHTHYASDTPTDAPSETTQTQTHTQLSLLSLSSLKGYTRLLYVRANYLINQARDSVISHGAGGGYGNKEAQSR